MGSSFTADDMTGNTMGPPVPLVPSEKPRVSAEQIASGAEGANFTPPRATPASFDASILPGTPQDKLPAPTPSPAQPKYPGSGWQEMDQYIARSMAAEGTGPDSHYPNIVSGFREDTWLNLMKQNPEFAQMPPDQVLELRNNPQVVRLATAALADQNAKLLRSVGIAADPVNLRLAAHWGPGGAAKILHSPPDTPMSAIFNGPKDQKMLAANNATDATAGDEIGNAHREMSTPTLRESLNATSSSLAQVAQARVDHASAAIAENSRSVLAGLTALQNKPGDPAIAKELGEAHEERKRLLSTYENLLKHPPPTTQIDAMQTFGSAASILGLIAGLFVRNHATAALSASGAAMKAAAQNDKDMFDRNMKIWDQETAAAVKMIDINNQDIREILDDRRMEFDEKNANIRTYLEAEGINMRGLEAQLTAADAGSRIIAQTTGLKEQMEASRFAALGPQADELMKKNPGMTMKDAYTQLAPDVAAWAIKGKLPGFETVDTQGKGREQEIQASVKSSDEAWLKDHPEAKEVPQDVHFQHRLDAEHSLTAATRQPRSGPAAATQAFIEETKAKTGRAPTAEEITDFNADYARKVATERVFGAGAEARMVTSMNTVVNHLESLRKYAEALKNGDVPLANQLANRIAVETGHDAPTNFAMAREIAGDEIARAVVGGVGAMGDRDSIKASLLAKNSPEQLAGGIGTAQEFLSGRLSELRRQYARGDTAREKVFDEQMLSPLARERIGAGSGGSALPTDLPDPKSLGAVEGQSLTKDGKTIAVLRNGKWEAP